LDFVDPNALFKGTLLVAAPHMDDEVLACGGTIAQLTDKERVFVAYATDGSRSPVPMFPWQGPVSPDLAPIRQREARSALGVLGIPKENVRFLGLPDHRLRAHTRELGHLLAGLLRQIAPAHILIPFRYDRHPDHLALHRAMTEALGNENSGASLSEYFVYYRWQLIAGKDIRKHIRQDHLVAVDIQACSSTKKTALLCYKSQTTCYFDWQDRPILPSGRVDEASDTPELFLRHGPAYPGASVFAGSRLWIRLVHTTEPALKRSKDQALALWKTIAPTHRCT
jgi:LmbE family N-acetylglucosaminyl deacetylase